MTCVQLHPGHYGPDDGNQRTYWFWATTAHKAVWSGGSCQHLKAKSSTTWAVSNDHVHTAVCGCGYGYYCAKDFYYKGLNERPPYWKADVWHDDWPAGMRWPKVQGSDWDETDPERRKAVEGWYEMYGHGCQICRQPVWDWMTCDDNWKQMPRSFWSLVLCIECFRKLIPRSAT